MDFLLDSANLNSYESAFIQEFKESINAEWFTSDNFKTYVQETVLGAQNDFLWTDSVVAYYFASLHTSSELNRLRILNMQEVPRDPNAEEGGSPKPKLDCNCGWRFNSCRMISDYGCEEPKDGCNIKSSGCGLILLDKCEGVCNSLW